MEEPHQLVLWQPIDGEAKGCRRLDIISQFYQNVVKPVGSQRCKMCEELASEEFSQRAILPPKSDVFYI